MDAVCSLDFSKSDEFNANEKRLNELYGDIAGFAVKLFPLQLSANDRLYISSVFRSVIDLERVGDYAENIMECARRLEAEGQIFPRDAAEEIRQLRQTCEQLYSNAMLAYKNSDDGALVVAYGCENKVDELTGQMSENNIKRLASGDLSPIAGAQFLSLIISAERVADHFINLIKVSGK
jgi:phosphate:Na+ symporter